MMSKKQAGIAASLVLAAALGAGVTWWVLSGDTADKQVNAKPVNQQEPVKQNPPQAEPAKPEPGKPTDGAKPGDSTKPGSSKPDSPSTPAPSDVVSFKGFTGSGTLSLSTYKLANEAFQLERLDWNESNKGVVIYGKMRAFEGVGAMRVRDENKIIVEPEVTIRAKEGAPAWSDIQATFTLDPAYKGKTLLVEFYTHSPNDGAIVNRLTMKIKPE